MSTEAMAVNIRKLWNAIQQDKSNWLVNAEYNYHDSLQSRLMSGGTFVDQPSKSRLSGFFSLFVSSQRNWVKALFVSWSISFVSCHTASLTIKDAWEPLIPRNSMIYSKAQHPAKIPHGLHKHVQCIHFTLSTCNETSFNNHIQASWRKAFPTALYSTNTVQQYQAFFKKPFLSESLVYI